MKIIKAFAVNSQYISNDAYVVSPIGEISTNSLSYAKDVGIYNDSTDKDNLLYTFRTLENDSYVALDVDWVEHIFTIVRDVYSQVALGSSSHTQWKDESAKYLLNAHQDIANSFQVGEIIKDGNHYCPAWIEWKRNHFDSLIRVWFSNKEFEESFDDYELTVVDPIEHLDDFFLSRNEVKKLVETQNDPVSMSFRSQKARDDKPYTMSVSLMFDWRDVNDDSYRLPVRWDVIVYGARGNNIDAIKDALIDHVLKNSTHSKDEWKKLFPDIFKRTEFVIVPRWDNYAIPNRTVLEGIYSPLVKYNDILTTLQDYTPEKFGYLQPHVSQYATVVAHQYRSLQTLVVSHPENRDNLFYLTDVYPDLIAVNSLSQDFNRQAIPSRIFSANLTEMIIAAESYTNHSVVPKGMTRLVREGKLYLVKSIDNVHYLVACKVNFYPNP